MNEELAYLEQQEQLNMLTQKSDQDRLEELRKKASTKKAPSKKVAAKKQTSAKKASSKKASNGAK